MERLTGWKENGRAYVIDCPEFELPEKANKVLQNLADKHAVIEDILGDTYDLDHLRELVEADKDGRCAALPCKIGDEVFVLHGVGGTVPFVTSAVVVGLHIRDEKARCGQPRREYLVVRSNGFSKHIPIDKIGKTVFLAREAAEAALAKEAK
ncbi:hypothetical protein [Candidatus Allofournierella merdipullorum]|uniref:hypothetical protein n=1 Tax=Candidatus Allofournierella merdipullorum TaxID=2838595 RepID=UPI00374E9C06